MARALIAHFLYHKLRMRPREVIRHIGHPHIDPTATYYYLPSRKKGSKTLVEDRMPYQKELRRLKEEIEGMLDNEK